MKGPLLKRKSKVEGALTDVEQAIFIIRIKGIGYEFAQLYLDTLERLVSTQKKLQATQKKLQATQKRLETAGRRLAVFDLM